VNIRPNPAVSTTTSKIIFAARFDEAQFDKTEMAVFRSFQQGATEML
jgi:hypothetical protein